MKKLIVPLISLAFTLLSCTPTTMPTSDNNSSSNSANGKPVIHRGGAGNTGGKDDIATLELGSIGKEPTGKGNKTLFAIYLLGSDLEDDVQAPKGEADEKTKGANVSEGAGSDDLREIYNAFKTLSDEEKKNLDIIVGFGGARKSGWKGIKYADATCISKDAEDNYFGNDSCYTKKDESVSMGNGNTLKDFVTYVKNTYPESNYGKRIMDLWDHGGAHRGYGPDTNTDEAMTLKEINDSLAADDTKYSMVGFDACLMGNLDVARFVKNHADYLLASEELEPGHGWQYNDVLTYIAKNPNSNIVDIGKKMVDSFVTSPDHAQTDGKTLSLVNLSKMDNLTSQLDNVFDSLGNNLTSVYAPILKAASGSQEYGKTGKGEKAFSVDLKNFVAKIKENNVATDTGNLENAINDFVVYSKDDGTRKDSNGVAIFAITNKSDFTEKAYKSVRAASDKWFNFVDKFVKNGLDDSSAPKVEESSQMQTASFKLKDTSDKSFKITDDKGVKQVLSVRATKSKDGTYMILGSEESQNLGNNVYTDPKWDGNVFMIDNQIVPMEFSEYTKDGKKVYIVDGTVNGEQATFNFKVDGNKVIDQWYVPYTEDDKGDILIGKEQYKLEANDEVYFSYLHINIDKDTEEWTYSEKITIQPNFQLTQKKATGELYFFIEAYDLKGNMQNSELTSLN